jgi:UPF0271 protein
MISSIDLNCDMGEGMPNDTLIMPFISSANIACGFHAGDENTMQCSIELAKEFKVAIGAHPSFPDRDNFGRTNMYLPAEQVYDLVKMQIEKLAEAALMNNCRLHHVKPHGALYNMAANDQQLAEAICNAVSSIDRSLFIYGLSGSKFISIAEEQGLKTVNEIFADRTYQKDGTLTPRNQPNALLHDEQDVKTQVIRILSEKQIKADSICIHGDGGSAVRFAKLIHKELLQNNYIIKAP